MLILVSNKVIFQTWHSGGVGPNQFASDGTSELGRASRSTQFVCWWEAGEGSGACRCTTKCYWSLWVQGACDVGTG